jgi:hypothetical protein
VSPARGDAAVLRFRYPRPGKGRARAPAVTCAPHRRSPWDQRKLATSGGKRERRPLPARQRCCRRSRPARYGPAERSVSGLTGPAQPGSPLEVGPICGFRRSIVASGRSHPSVELGGGSRRLTSSWTTRPQMLLGGRSTRQAVVLNSRPVVSPRSGGVPFDRGTIDTGARTVRCGFRPVARLSPPPFLLGRNREVFR